MNAPYGWTEDAYREYLEYKQRIASGSGGPDAGTTQAHRSRASSSKRVEDAFWENVNIKDGLPAHEGLWQLSELVQQPDVRAVMAGYFSFPPRAFKMECIAPPLTRNYSTVGTAFDYLMRFLIKHHDPSAVDVPWIALHGVAALFAIRSPLATRAEAILGGAIDAYKDFLDTGEVTERLLICALQLAQLDAVYRAGWIDERLGETDAADVADLEQLMALIPLEQFVGNTPTLLNPPFNRCRPVNVGADPDLVMGDALIDIKVTKHNIMRLEFFRQLVGYYSLAVFGGFSSHRHSMAINRVGIYFARCGHLVTFAIDDLRSDRPLEPWLEWLTERSFKGRFGSKQTP